MALVKTIINNNYNQLIIMANIAKNLKKMEIGNPLINLELFSLYDIYQAAKTDEELCDAYKTILDAVEGSQLAETLVYAMISYSTGAYENPLYMHVEREITKHNILVENENRLRNRG